MVWRTAEQRVEDVLHEVRLDDVADGRQHGPHALHREHTVAVHEIGDRAVERHVDVEHLLRRRGDEVELAPDDLLEVGAAQRCVHEVELPKRATCSGLNRRVSAFLMSTTVIFDVNAWKMSASMSASPACPAIVNASSRLPEMINRLFEQSIGANIRLPVSARRSIGITSLGSISDIASTSIDRPERGDEVLRLPRTDRLLACILTPSDPALDVAGGVGQVGDRLLEVAAVASRQPTVGQQLPEVGELRRRQRLAVAVEGVEPLDLVEQDHRRLAVEGASAGEHRRDRRVVRRAVAVRQFDLDEPIEQVEGVDQLAHEVGLAHAGHAPQVHDHRSTEDLGHHEPHRDRVAQFVDDAVDADEALLQLTASVVESGAAGVDHGRVDDDRHSRSLTPCERAPSKIGARRFVGVRRRTGLSALRRVRRRSPR